MPENHPESVDQSTLTDKLAQRQRQLHQRYAREAAEIRDKHVSQTGEQAALLRQKYLQPLFGEVKTWSLFEMLAHCIDSSDDRLYCASQEVHSLQIIEAMEADGVATEEFTLAALVHDIGKVALLAGELPENLLYMNTLLETGGPGCGLDACTLQWSCDDLAWTRLKDYLPAPVAWLVRYHSITVNDCKPYMNARDLEYSDKYLATFRAYDLYSKSPFFRPRRPLRHYRALIEQYLPPTLLF